eukprot:scaffold325937_cov36-Prasinocladus_malaysianus.AAC.2
MAGRMTLPFKSRYCSQCLDVKLTLGLHGVPVDGVLDSYGSVVVKVSKSSADERRTAVLPEQPVEALNALPGVRGYECVVFLGDVFQNAACLEDSERWGEIVVQKRRDLRIRVYVNKTRPELIQLEDVGLPGIILDPLDIVQLFEQNRDFLAVWRAQTVQL